LTDAAGTVTDRYVYDAFGQILAQSGNTINTYLFAGQQRDSSLGMDYLRARFLNFNTGRFASADTFLGLTRMPLTLNKYLYTAQNPVNFTDPGGHFSLGDLAASDAIQGILDAVEAIGESQSFIKTVQAISDFIFVGTTALTILAAISVHGFKAGLAVELEEPNPDSAIKKFSFALTVDKGDLIATISVTTQGSDKLGYAEDNRPSQEVEVFLLRALQNQPCNCDVVQDQRHHARPCHRRRVRRQGLGQRCVWSDEAIEGGSETLPVPMIASGVFPSQTVADSAKVRSSK
jgi:RHS repeat-associated protein